MAPEVLLISKTDQGLIRGAAHESVGHMRRAEREQTAREALAATGIIVNPVDRAAFAKAMHPLFDRFTASPRLKELLHRIQAVE